MAVPLCRLLAIGILLALTIGQSSFGQPPQSVSAEQLRNAEAAQRKLEQLLATTLRDSPPADVADATIFVKGLVWALRYDRTFSPADDELIRKAIPRTQKRVEALRAGDRPWARRKGKLALGYVSRIDGSVQPYGLIVPRQYQPGQPIRLDVVLHGSMRPVGMSELRFINRFDAGDEGDGDGGATAPDQPFIELHPLGRVENCYRWAGETDVFEAIDDVCRRYSIDRDRIVLRGMSMGASGTWHLGLKHPDRFVALGPYCGYVDTHRFSSLPFPHFVRVGPLPEHQEAALHMLDSIDYAANARVVPVIACMGEKDEAFECHVLMAEAMRREGLQMVNLISPGTGHTIDPVTHAEQMKLIGAFADRGLNHAPPDLRFVTWTVKYGRCHWLQVLGLQKHYSRAEISARLRNHAIEIDEPTNITRFAILTPDLPVVLRTLRVGGQEIAVPAVDSVRDNPAGSRGIVLERRNERWTYAGKPGETAASGKRPGPQGPIDDAFTTPFLCVRGTGAPWNPAIQAYAEASLARFAEEWRRYFRGEPPIKDDAAVTEDDVRTRNLILFGDPGSNSWIARALPHLPLTWTKDALRFGGVDFQAVDHLPALVVPNPLAGGEDRYLVLNSGHTFREAELAKLNYLLFPRWGDWAILRIDPSRDKAAAAVETVVKAGYFDEQWRAP